MLQREINGLHTHTYTNRKRERETYEKERALERVVGGLVNENKSPICGPII